MRVVPFIAAAMAAIVLIVLFDTRLLLPAPLGRLLSPQHGVWQNAEPADAGLDAALTFPQLKATAQVYFDERLVPHVLQKMMQTHISSWATCMRNSVCGRWSFRHTAPAEG